MGSKKQDRQGVRKAVELERKYDLGNESKAINAARQAVAAANRAAADVANLSQETTAALEQVREALELIQQALTRESLLALLTEETGTLELEGLSAGSVDATELSGDTLTAGEVNGKAVRWNDNGDGTFTLMSGEEG